jgi:23S rRNA (pseudouridine1915-N3)-methyltransferase
MRVAVLAVGRLRDGPEAALTGDYLARATRAGRSLGLGPFTQREVEDRRGGGMASEAALLAEALPRDALRIALDERGRALTSPALAGLLADWRDRGTRDAAFVIGGAEGLARDLVAGADLVLSLGPMVWPHALARAMLAEQLYRAVTILAGSPYHRG